MSAPPAGRPAPRRRPDESMTLITEMMQQPLDPGYAAAASKRNLLEDVTSMEGLGRIGLRCCDGL